MLWLVAGVIVGVGFQLFLDGPATSGIRVADSTQGNGAIITSMTGKKGRGEVKVGNTIQTLILHRGEKSEATID